MDEIDWRGEPGDLLTHLEMLYSEIWDYSAAQEIPLEINLHPHTRERLSSPLLYDVIGIAGSIEKKQAEHLAGELSEEQALGRVYPMLGNAIQVACEYVNGFIDRRELAEFYGRMAREGSTAMKDAGPEPDEPFFTPSSFYKRNGKVGRTHHVLKNRQTIDKHHKLFMRFEKQYKSDFII